MPTLREKIRAMPHRGRAKVTWWKKLLLLWAGDSPSIEDNVIKLKGTISARHYHADTGQWEDLGVISEVK